MNKKSIHEHDELEGHDWNEGHPDHEGEMAVSQLHRIAEMAEMLLDIINENDELPGWVQYKLGRAYNDMSDLFGYIESKSHDFFEEDLGDEGGYEDDISDFGGAGLEEAKGKCSGCKGKNPGLWCNICKKRARGEPPAKPGEKGRPKTLNIESSNVRHILRSMIRQSLKR